MQARCPHCEGIVESESFVRGRTVTCPACARSFLPIQLSSVPVAAAVPPPSRSPVALKAAPEPVPVAPPARKADEPPRAAREVAEPPETNPAPRGNALPPRVTQKLQPGAERVRAVSCHKCKALLRLSAGESKFGKCQACGQVFIFDPKDVSDLLLAPDEARALPLFQLLIAGEMGDEIEEGTIRRSPRGKVTRPVGSGPQAVLISDVLRLSHPLETSTVVIGRSGADLNINDPDVSRRHASIEHAGGKLVIRDLKSTNGTYLNGARVEKEVLKDGDRIRLGTTELRLCIERDGERRKHLALFIELGPGAYASDIRRALDVVSLFGKTECAEWKPDVVLSPPTGRGLIIWAYDGTLLEDEQRRLLPRILVGPSALRQRLSSVTQYSEKPIQPLVGLAVGLARRDVVDGRVRFEGPLLQKVALAFKCPGRDAVFVSDIESLQLLTQSRSPEALASQLRDLGLHAAPAGPGQPFVILRSVEVVKSAIGGADRAASSREQAAAHGEERERDATDVLAREFHARMESALAASPADVKTSLYEGILRGTPLSLSADDVRRWMKELAAIAQSYSAAIAAERERIRAEGRRGPGYTELLGVTQEDLAVARDAARLLPGAFTSGEALAGIDLRTLAFLGREAIKQSAPAPLAAHATLERVCRLLMDVDDVPTDGTDARNLFELYTLLALVRALAERPDGTSRMLAAGILNMSRLAGILKLSEHDRAGGSIFEAHQLPGLDLIP
ncbi:MAG: FHA domain-containing protein [Acidobacteriota bacterium]